jgi:hypothetical protein
MLTSLLRHHRTTCSTYNASNTISLALSFTILRRSTEPLLPRPSATSTMAAALHVGGDLNAPVFSYNGDLSRFNGLCSAATIEIVRDLQSLTEIYLDRCSHVSSLDTEAHARAQSCDARLQLLYARHLRRPSAEEDQSPDWIYESCRLVSLIWCRSIVHGLSLVDAASLIITGHDSTNRTLLSALYAAVLQTDTHNCWGEMRSFFLQVCILGGAASWPSSRSKAEDKFPTRAWMRKSFALWTLKATVAVPFDEADTSIKTLQKILRVRHLVDLHSGAHMLS